MKYAYKSFAFICFVLSVVTKEKIIIEAPDNSIELFDNILYQRIDKVDNDIKDIYFAWSIIKKLIDTNNSFLYKPYQKVLDGILYGKTEYEITENFDVNLLRSLKSHVSSDKGLYSSFFEMGADCFLNELIACS